MSGKGERLAFESVRKYVNGLEPSSDVNEQEPLSDGKLSNHSDSFLGFFSACFFL